MLLAAVALDLMLFCAALGPCLTLLLLALKGGHGVPWSWMVVLGLGALLLLGSWMAFSIASRISAAV